MSEAREKTIELAGVVPRKRVGRLLTAQTMTSEDFVFVGKLALFSSVQLRAVREKGSNDAILFWVSYCKMIPVFVQNSLISDQTSNKVGVFHLLCFSNSMLPYRC